MRFIHSVYAIPLTVFCLFLSPTAQADDGLNLTLGGFINMQAGYSSQESGFDAGTRPYGFRNDTELLFEVSGGNDVFKYGASLELEADVTADARAEGLNADKTYIWLEPSWGRFEFGNNEGAEATMATNAAAIAKATGGIDGDDEFYINATGLAGTSAFLIHPDLVGADVGGIAEDATKITYYTPVLSGFQLGLSYVPDQGDGGQIATRNKLNGDIENVFSGGISYEHQWGEWELETSLVGEYGQSELNTQEDVRTWQWGALIGWNNIQVAGSYGDWGDSTMAKGSNLDTEFWTLGAAYDWDALGTSPTYFNSDRGGNEYEAVVAGAEYALAPGLTPYVDVTFFEADEAGNPIDNEGTVVLIGTILSF